LLVLGGLLVPGELSLIDNVDDVGSAGSGPQRNGYTAAGPASPALGADGSLSTRGAPAGTIALTFDDGPDPVWTLQVLVALRRHGTLFVIGSQVNGDPGRCGA
jgi:peptidoglycan/xylan/chitin deacetylase (PgdA/CDA1 family)